MCTLLLLEPQASACSVPVFRYALERWRPDPYEVVVFHRGELTPAQKRTVDVLSGTEEGPSEARAPANVRVLSVDLSDEPAESMRGLWEAQEASELPWMVLRCRRVPGRGRTVWSGPLSAAAARAVLDSPVRREIARRLLKGDAVVWILLESGDRRKDDAAAGLLRDRLERLEEALELPQPWVDEAARSGRLLGPDDAARSGRLLGPDDAARSGRLLGPDDAGADAQVPPELPLALSMVRLSRSDPAEGMLVRMLLKSEPDLERFAEPVAFPVFGRGRVLYALVGRGISAGNVAEACAFLTGPCSCIVKAGNPGTDLVMSVDWGGLVAGRASVDEEVVGGGGFSVSVAAEEDEVDGTERDVRPDDGAGRSGPGLRPDGAARSEPRLRPDGAAVAEGASGTAAGALWRNVVLVAAIGTVVVLAVSLALARRRGSRPT